MEQKFTNDMDFNFKLVIIDNLLYNKQNLRPDFQKQYQDILNSVVYQTEKSKIISNNVDDVCTELYNYVKTLKLSNEDLDKINELKIDTIAKIYSDLQPNWDGYSNKFNIYNINGIEKLKNLKKVDVVLAMIDHDISNNVEDILKTLNCEVLINDGFEIYNIKKLNKETNSQINENITSDIDFDFNFKLVIIDNLLYNTKPKLFPSFEKQYQDILNSNAYKTESNDIINNSFTDKYCCSLYEYLKNLKITQEDLNKIETLYFDGGSQIYIDLAPNWDGESELFDVKNIDGIEQLENLKKVNVFSMAHKTVEEKLKKLKYEVWINDEKNSAYTDDNLTNGNNIVNIHSKLNENINSFIDVMSDNFKYKLGTIFDDKLKNQLISDGFRDAKNIDFGLRQEYYTDDKLYLSFNTDSFEENANLILNSIMILEDNKENSFMGIKINDYNISAKSILEENNYKELISDVENIRKHLDVEKNILLELWLNEYRIYKIVVEQISKEDAKNYEFIPEVKVDPWVKENLNKIIFSDEKYGQFRLTGFNGEMLFSEKSVMFGKYEINDLELSYYKPENHQIYINTLNYVFDNEQEIIEKMYEFALNICKEWNEQDFNGNEITMEFIKTHFTINHIDIDKEFATVWGVLIENGNTLLGGHNINANINFETKKINVGLEG